MLIHEGILGKLYDPSTVFLIYSGYNWWLAVEKEFMARFYKPFPTSVRVQNNKLNILIDSPEKTSSWVKKQVTIREHGKIITEHDKWVHIYIFDHSGLKLEYNSGGYITAVTKTGKKLISNFTRPEIN